MTASSILDKILEAKRDEVEERRAERPLADLQARCRDLPPPRAFAPAVRRSPGAGPRGRGGAVRAIAEIKRASPSRGPLRPDLDPAALARQYAAAGAAALSVLTDGPFFQGSLADLQAARDATALPVLRKDFTVDPYQVWEARAASADGILLIARALTPTELADLVGLAGELGLAPLVEVHEATELEIALEAGAGIVGINNRDLRTFRVSLETTFTLLPLIPADRTVISESGLGTRSAVERVEAAGVDALLIGEALVVAPDPGARLAEILAGP